MPAVKTQLPLAIRSPVKCSGPVVHTPIRVPERLGVQRGFFSFFFSFFMGRAGREEIGQLRGIAESLSLRGLALKSVVGQR